MGKRRDRRELLRGQSKKQKKHLREFEEEHPFHDKVSGRPEATQICELSENSDKSSAESDSETEVEQVSVYHKLLATLKTSPESESEEEEDKSESEEAEESEAGMDSEGSQETGDADGGEDKNDVPEEKEATDTAEQMLGQEQDDGADTSCDPHHGVTEEFTDVKHESEFSLETNFMEEESGGCNADMRDSSSSQAVSEGSDKWTHQERRLFKEALSTYSKDFIYVQKMVKSKTVAQCVEYYYTWKKIWRLGRKHRTRLEKKRDECLTSGEEEVLEEDEEIEEDRKEEREMQKSPDPPPIPLVGPIDLPPLQGLPLSSSSFICEMPNCGAVFSSRQALNGHARIHGGTNQVTKTRCTIPGTKQKSGTQSGYCSIKSSPAHSTTSGETDPTTIFPCKECGKVFFKIKSRNAHMKFHRQQEEQQRQKAQKAAVAAEMAATIARTTGPAGHSLIPLDHMGLVKHVENVGDIDDDVVPDLSDVMELPRCDVLLLQGAYATLAQHSG